MTSVVLEHITKRYGAAPASVNDLSLSVEDGEFFTLLGPSGCGKSTTLRMIAGFISPSEGTIRFDDRDITRQPPHRRDTGMVFQNYALFPHMDVATNVAYGLRMRRVGGAERDRRVQEALGIVGLEGYAERRIDQLSGGQQQRVALARALVISPSVLLLDEPLSNLDAKLRDETRTQIRQIQQRSGTTSVYVTHDQAEAMAMSDRIAVMDAGVLHQLGTPREVYRRPATSFVARFIGRSNVVDGRIVEIGSTMLTVATRDGAILRAPIVVGSHSADVSVGQEVGLSIRPEAVELLGPAPAQSDRERGTLRARVTLVEFTGATCVIGLDLDGSRFLISVPDSDDLPGVGQDVALRPDVARTWVVAP